MLSNAVGSDTLSLTQSCCRLPTAIQYECIPLVLGGGDVLAAAETGSGKTGAFGLPILQVVHESIRSRQAGGTSGSGYVFEQFPTLISYLSYVLLATHELSMFVSVRAGAMKRN